jgi:hypothetical protein
MNLDFLSEKKFNQFFGVKINFLAVNKKEKSTSKKLHIEDLL